jgi:hypothetical protein
MKAVSSLIVSIGCVFAFTIAIAHADHAWGGYHWARTANPLQLKLGDNVSTAWDSYLRAASADWSLSDVLDTTVVTGKSNPKTCRAVNGRVEVCNSKYGNNGWLGIASIWVNGTHITQGTVKLNDTYFNTPTYNTPAWRQFVACQEIGHTFGLDHQDEAFDNPNLGTCMDYTNDPTRDDGAGTNLHPNTHDYDELALIYAHLDTINTSFSSVSSTRGADIDTSDRAEWGKEIKRSHDGRASLHERDLGHGQRLFTFIIWAK